MDGSDLDLQPLHARLAELERELAEERRKNALAAQLIENAPVGIQVFGVDGLTLLINRAQVDFLGLADREVAYAFNVLTDPFAVENGSAAIFQRARDGEIVHPPELEVDLSKASSRWGTAERRATLQQLVTPVNDDEGKVVAMASFQFDVTERRRTERALIAAQRHESLGLLAGGIAHDFNNLLVSILGNASLAELELPPRSKAAQAIERITVASQRAADLTRQMLAYAGRGRVEVKALDVNEVAREMLDLLRANLAPATRLHADLRVDLPAVRADAAQLRQVLMNLVTNADRALEGKAGVVIVATQVVEVEADARHEAVGSQVPAPGTYVSIEVSDTGVGMSPQVQARIFEPFFTTRPDGHGLGLAATLGIVRAHAGAIRVYSEPGKGSTFTLLLPAVGEKADPRPPPPRGSAPGGAAHVLVIDDTPSVHQVASQALAHFGYRVSGAHDGEEGLALVGRDPAGVDVVLLDLTMPGMDGVEVFGALRRIRPDLPVVLSSGYTRSEAVARFAGRGLTGFLQKPYTVRALAEAIAGALGRS